MKNSNESFIFKGILKFFDNKNNFGFIKVSNDSYINEVFVYGTEFIRCNISLDYVKYFSKTQNPL